MVRFGVPGQNISPLSYADDRLSVVPMIDAPRAPTVNDKKFPMWTEWRVNKSALSPAVEGDFWKLVRFESNGNATWVKFAGGGAGPILGLTDDSSTQVLPDANGDIQLDGTAGQISVTADAVNNKLIFALAGSGTAIDSFIVPSGTSPVVPNASGQVTINAGTGVTVTGGTNEYTIGLTGGGISVDSFAVPSGTSPVIPDANGLITITAGSGITVTGGTNTYEISLSGGGQAVDSFGIDSISGTGVDPVTPDANGNIDISASQVAAGTIGANVIDTHSSIPNTYNIRIQQADAVASKDTTKNGVAHFDSGYFSDDEGFISLANGFYATGTWTPVLSFGGGSTGITYSVQQGQYTRIGNVVYFHYRCVLTSKGSSTGTAYISGLPYTVGSTLDAYGNNGSMSAGTLPGTATQFHNSIQPATTTIELRGTTPATNSQLTDANFANNTTFGCTGFYWV